MSVREILEKARHDAKATWPSSARETYTNLMEDIGEALAQLEEMERDREAMNEMREYLLALHVIPSDHPAHDMDEAFFGGWINRVLGASGEDV